MTTETGEITGRSNQEAYQSFLNPSHYSPYHSDILVKREPREMPAIIHQREEKERVERKQFEETDFITRRTLTSCEPYQPFQHNYPPSRFYTDTPENMASSPSVNPDQYRERQETKPPSSRPISETLVKKDPNESVSTPNMNPDLYRERQETKTPSLGVVGQRTSVIKSTKSLKRKFPEQLQLEADMLKFQGSILQHTGRY